MRSDLDVQMRRRWFVMPQYDGSWIVMRIASYVPVPLYDTELHCFIAPHPLGLLTRADEALKKEGR